MTLEKIKNHAKKLLPFLAVGCLLTFIVNYIVVEKEYRQKISHYATEQNSQLLQFRSIFEHSISTSIHDYTTFVKIPAFQMFLTERSNHNKTLLENTWMSVIDGKRSFEKVVFISKDGVENLKIIQHKHGKPEVSKADMHFVGNKQYFVGAKKLSGGKIFMSLDKESRNNADKFELHISTPVYVGTEFIGVVLVCHDLSVAFEELESEFGKTQIFDYLITDQNGLHLYTTKTVSSYDYDGLYESAMFDLEHEVKRTTTFTESQPNSNTGIFEVTDFGKLIGSTDLSIDESLKNNKFFVISVIKPEFLKDVKKTLWNDYGYIYLIVTLFILNMYVMFVRMEEKIIRLNKEKIELESDLRLQESFQVLMDSVNVSVIAFDTNKSIKVFNQRAEKLFGYTPEEAIGMSIEMFIPEKCRDKKNILKYFKQSKYGKCRIDSDTVTILHKDGNEIPVEIGVSEYTVMGEKRHILVLVDLYEQKLMGEKLKYANAKLEELVAVRTKELSQANAFAEKAERAERAMSMFLSNMSHEIRTPMNGILGICQILERKDLPMDQKRLIRQINTAGNNLLNIINDILDFSKIEAGKLKIEKIPFLLMDVLDNVKNVLVPTIGKKKIEMIFSVNPFEYANLQLIGDPLRLNQILINIIGNSIKFTDAGEVVLDIFIKDTDIESEKLLVLKISDTGIGIPKDKINAIFSPFTQADSSTTRNYGGTGIGLTITRRLVGLMHGHIEVESEVNVGTTFTIEIPVDSSEYVHEEVPYQKVLLIDDNDHARIAISNLIYGLKWDVEARSSGEDAIEYIQNTSLDNFDIILIDWDMPGMDGVKTMIKLKELEMSDDKKPMIIMFTSFNQINNHEHDEDLIDKVIVKPLTSYSLFESFTEFKSLKKNALVHSTPDNYISTGRDLKDISILVVDDSEINREIAKELLEGEGAKVYRAYDGENALTIINNPSIHLDIILMDIQMPGMNGYDTTKKIRENPKFKNLPIVALTAGVLHEQKVAAENATMDAFIGKPFKLHELSSTILRLVNTSKSAEIDNSNLMIFNEDVGIQYFKSKEKLCKFLSVFLEKYHDKVDILRSDDLDSVRFYAHSLKSEAGVLGLEKLVELTKVVEQNIIKGENSLKNQDALCVLLFESFTVIEKYLQVNMAVEKTQEVTINTLDLKEISRILNNCVLTLKELDSYNIEPLVNELKKYLPSDKLKNITAAIDSFDDYATLLAIKDLALELDIHLSE